ncbi:lysine N(6)-hydroxylase/L-ornithine N(5)-oxygenase family protein [Streptomyces sp. NPDC002454]
MAPAPTPPRPASPAPVRSSAPPSPRPESATPRDLIGIGIGPFNLSLAALAHPLTTLDAVFYDQHPAFHWHPGLLLGGATLQVPFLADLVTLVDPANPWTFLNYLRAHERLFPFYFAERFHIHRTEYDAYCRWVSEGLPSLRFGHRVDSVRWNRADALFDVELTRLDPDGHPLSRERARAKNVALGIGTAPHVPEPLRPLADDPAVAVHHAADYLTHRERLATADHLTVIGSGQSGAEVFLDLLRQRPPGRERLHWLARTEAFAPMEYSKLGLEHFTPDYTHYFHGLPASVRESLVPRQWQLHKGIDTETISAIHEELYRRTLHGGWPDVVLTPAVEVRSVERLADARIALHLEHRQQHRHSRLATDAVVLATGYRERPLGPVLADLVPLLRHDETGRLRVDRHQRLVLDPSVVGPGRHVYVQNAERHTHGVGTPDLGLAAWRGATILNDLTGKNPYPLPARTAFTTFGLGPVGSRAQDAPR